MIRVGDLLLSQYFFLKKYYLEVFLKVKLIFLLIIKVVFIYFLYDVIKNLVK